MFITNNEGVYSASFPAFNTEITLKLWIRDANAPAAKKRADEFFGYIETLCERYEKLFSRTLATSDLTRLNNAKGLPVSVAPEVADLIGKSLQYCEATQGKFDISMGTITPLWDFHTGKVPDKNELAEALHHVDFRKIKVMGNIVELHDPAMRIDLGGIAKGYICDKIVDYIRTEATDVGGGIIDLGGNLYVLGTKPNGTDWAVGIRNPKDTSEIVAACKLKDVSIVTSGIYERAFEADGNFFHHILDPKTGYPALSDIASITVISDTSLDGDGYTTGLLMMGSTQAMEFSQELSPSIELVIVMTSGEIYYSAGLLEHEFVLVSDC